MRYLLLILSMPLGAQSFPTWVGVGALYTGEQSPHYSGWAAVALPVGTQGLYSWSMDQIIPNKKTTPTTETSTGAALVLRTFAVGKVNVDLVGIATIGSAISSVSVTAALSGGGGLMFHSKSPTLAYWVGYLMTKANGVTVPEYMTGVGLTFGKTPVSTPVIITPDPVPPPPAPKPEGSTDFMRWMQ
jgi:hypothetical protein